MDGCRDRDRYVLEFRRAPGGSGDVEQPDCRTYPDF